MGSYARQAYFATFFSGLAGSVPTSVRTDSAGSHRTLPASHKGPVTLKIRSGEDPSVLTFLLHLII